MKKNWDSLDYIPNEEFVIDVLNKIKSILNALTLSPILDSKRAKMLSFDDQINKYDRCDIHKVFLHPLGCIICNDK